MARRSAGRGAGGHGVKQWCKREAPFTNNHRFLKKHLPQRSKIKLRKEISKLYLSYNRVCSCHTCILRGCGLLFFIEGLRVIIPKQRETPRNSGLFSSLAQVMNSLKIHVQAHNMHLIMSVMFPYALC